jgi:hypothetical protein
MLVCTSLSYEIKWALNYGVTLIKELFSIDIIKHNIS